jgi:hypothetical protein
MLNVCRYRRPQIIVRRLEPLDRVRMQPYADAISAIDTSNVPGSSNQTYSLVDLGEL